MGQGPEEAVIANAALGRGVRSLVRGMSLAGSVPLLACAAGVLAMDPPKLVTFQEVLGMPAGPATKRCRYGDDPVQFADLRVPEGAGPFPVAIVIHGGCWQAHIADLKYMEPIADALRKAGVATLNIEYRKAGNEGGGWPGTFLDVARAADSLRTIAAQHKLDLDRVIAIGHSAGGHLALWLAARPRVPRDSAIFSTEPIRLSAVLSLAGIADLAAYASDDPDACGNGAVRLLGGLPSQVPDRYSHASPVALLPVGVPQTIIHGVHDRPVPVELARAYVAAARERGDTVRYIELPEAGHFDVVAPGTQAWTIVQRAVLDATSAPMELP